MAISPAQISHYREHSYAWLDHSLCHLDGTQAKPLREVLLNEADLPPGSSMLSPLQPLILLLLLAGFAAAAEPTAPPLSIWAKAVPYGQATAQAPGFSATAVWPHLSGKEYFLKTVWPKARALTWAHPGESGYSNKLDPLDPANWIDSETGKPATELCDLDTDLVLPASTKDYDVDWIQVGHGKQPQGLRARCVTIGSKAAFKCGGATIRGSVWVQRDGSFLNMGMVTFGGGQHCFFRNDNDRSLSRNRVVGWWVDPTQVSQYLKLDKGQDASLEFLGHSMTIDEFQVESGSLIVGSDSVLEMGRECYPYIAAKGRIVLLNNAWFAKFVIDFYACDLEVRGGTLQAGLPERPLTRDAYFRIGVKNFSKAIYKRPAAKNEDEEFMKTYMQAREPGMILRAGSSLRSLPAAGSQAKLVISPLPYDFPYNYLRPIKTSREYKESLGNPERVAFYAWLDALPKGIDLAIAKGVTVEGVRFESLRAGGLMLEDLTATAGWKGVVWGEGNAGDLGVLSAPLSLPGTGRGY